jgi:hypothetical protein
MIYKDDTGRWRDPVKEILWQHRIADAQAANRDELQHWPDIAPPTGKPDDNAADRPAEIEQDVTLLLREYKSLTGRDLVVYTPTEETA